MCNGSGLITPQAELKALSSQESRVFTGQTRAQKARDADAKFEREKVDNAQVKHRPTAAEETANRLALDAARRASIVMEADARREEAAVAAANHAEFVRPRESKAAAVELAEKLAREGNFKAIVGADLATVNLRRREMKMKLEVNLEEVLEAKRAGLVRAGPYRCNRCSWIHERTIVPCNLCGASDGFTEAV